MSEDGLEALYDRFLLKYVVRPIQEETNFKKMIGGGYGYTPKTMITMEEIYSAIKQISKVEMNEGMVELLIKLRRLLNTKGIKATDRTYNICKRILQSQAFMEGREEVIEEDFTILRHALWTDPDDERSTLSIIFDLVSPETGKIMEYFEEAKDIVEKTLKVEDDKKRMDKGMDAAGKIKTIKQHIGGLIKTMEKKGKDTKEAREYDDKLSEMFEEVFRKSIGIKIPSLK